MSDRAVARYLKDFDNDGPHVPARGGRDGDDDEIVARFGHPVTVGEARAIVAAVRRYYAVARRGEGRRACSMVAPSVAGAMALNFGRFGYPYAHHARTCAQTMDLMLEHLRHRLSGSIAAMNVAAKGDHAYVLLGSTTAPAAFVTLLRSHGAWRMDEPLGGDMY